MSKMIDDCLVCMAETLSISIIIIIMFVYLKQRQNAL